MMSNNDIAKSEKRPKESPSGSKRSISEKEHRSCISCFFRPFTLCISSISKRKRLSKKQDTRNEVDGDSVTAEKSDENQTSSDDDLSSTPHQLPPLQDWPNLPIYIQASGDTECCDKLSVPIGVPVDFETALFKGKILIRVRNIPISKNHQHCNDTFETNPTKDQEKQFHCEEYFRNNNRMRQYVIQGQFKKTINMADVYVGDFYKKPLRMVPPPFIEKILKAAFRRVEPGLIMDITSKKPKVVLLMAGAMKTISIDKPGNEPAITRLDLPENTKLIKMDIENGGGKSNQDGKYSSGFQTQAMRKKVLSNPTTASQFDFHPGKVYTFSNFDEIFDLSTYSIIIPGTKKRIQLFKFLDGQSTTIRASKTNGECIYNFNVFHESMFPST